MNYLPFLDFFDKAGKLVPVLGFRDARTLLAGTGRRMRFFCIAAKAYPYIDVYRRPCVDFAEMKSALRLSCNGIRICLAFGMCLPGMALYPSFSSDNVQGGGDFLCDDVAIRNRLRHFILLNVNRFSTKEKVQNDCISRSACRNYCCDLCGSIWIGVCGNGAGVRP